jgi:hypothetical protein
MFDLKTNWVKSRSALAKNLISTATRKQGSSNEQIVLFVFFVGAQWNGRQQPFFGPPVLIQKC